MRRFLSGLPAAMSYRPRTDEKRVALVADANAVDHPPQFFQRDFRDQPPGSFRRLAESNGDHRRRERVVIELQRRNVDARFRDVRGIRKSNLRAYEAAGGEAPAARFEQRDFAELRKIEHVVAKHAILLPLGEVGIEKLHAHRTQHADVVVEVQADALGDLAGDLQVSVRDRILRAAPEVGDR